MRSAARTWCTSTATIATPAQASRVRLSADDRGRLGYARPSASLLASAGRAPNAQVESANRRLALALGGELGCIDIARLLRPPDTLNYKHSRRARSSSSRTGRRPATRSLSSRAACPTIRSVRPPGHAASAQLGARTPLDHALLAIPATEYVRVLANATPNRAGKVLCPFHADTSPSLQLYPDGTFYCYGRPASTGRAARAGRSSTSPPRPGGSPPAATGLP